MIIKGPDNPRYLNKNETRDKILMYNSDRLTTHYPFTLSHLLDLPLNGTTFCSAV